MDAPILTPSPAWSVRLLAELDGADEKVRELVVELQPEQLNGRPRPDAWSIGQCLEHLCRANEGYLPAILSSLEGSRSLRSRRSRRDGSAGGSFATTSSHRRKASAFGAPKKIVPGTQVEPSVLDRFLCSNQAARDLVHRARDCDVNRIQFRNPFVSVIRFTVGTGLNGEEGACASTPCVLPG